MTQFWASISSPKGRKIAQTDRPYAERADAEHYCLEQLYCRAPEWKRRNLHRKFTISSGYGTLGAHFDIRFRDVRLSDT